MFSSANGRFFAVSGSKLYEVDSSASGTELGALDSSDGIVTMAENNTQLAICDGSKLYILTYSTNDFQKITLSSFPTSVGVVTFIDGYFVVNENGTGRFYISGINDGLSSWDALDFATAESSPDNLVSVVNAVGQMFLFGSETTEVWTNTGDSLFPFRRISGAKMQTGILSPFTAVEIDNSVIWLGRDKLGQGIVYRAQGFTPIRISTTPIEILISHATDPANMRSYVYQEEGNTFYVLTGGGLATTLVYDLLTQEWHERAYLNSSGNYETDLACCHAFAFRKHLVGDRRNGKIYEQSLDFYTDDGDLVSRKRIYTHLSDSGKRIRYNSLDIGFEAGVGLQTGQGSNPLATLRLSKDGARTWSDAYTATIGAVGQYQQKIEFRRLGITEQMTFEIEITDPVKVAIIGSYLR